MPSFQDSAVIFFLALLLFGPKKLPELARQLGKLMGEFRRASNEFRMQMEDELRASEQVEQQKKIAEMQAAAPVPPAIPEVSGVFENTIAQPADVTDGFASDQNHEFKAEPVAPAEPLPIATSGDLNLMPPSTGLPVASTSMSHAFDSVPHASAPATTTNVSSTDEYALQQAPDRHTSNSELDRTTTEAPLHG
jgi:sec-independent protein translocase protein TatB